MTDTTVITSETPITWNWKLKTGKDFNRTVQLKEDDNTTPINTTGYDMIITIKESQNGETFDTWDITGGEITHTPSTGTFELSIPAATINAYNWSRAIYELQIISATSEKDIPFKGAITLE